MSHPVRKFAHVFEGYGVGLTVTPLGSEVPEPAAPPGVVVRPSRLTDVLPVAEWSDAEQAMELQRVQAMKSSLAAYEAALVMALAANRPATGTHSEGPIPGTDEFFVEELALITNATVRSGARLAGNSAVLVTRLPHVWAALADGDLDIARANVFVDVLGPTAHGVAEAVAPRVLADASGLSLSRLRARLLREVLAEDASAAEQRRQEAEQRADVRVFPIGDGMTELTAEMPAPLAAACWSTVDELAWMAKNDGDPRPIGQLRSGVLADLILRPWDTSRPAVTAHLTVIAPLHALTRTDQSPAPGGDGAAPGPASAEVDGQSITAAHVRELLAQLDALCPGGLQAPTGGSLQIAVTDADGALLASTGRRELERIARHGCPDHPSADAAGPVSDPSHPAAADCGCPVVQRPRAVDRYGPSAAQRRFVKQRDRTCRHPNCGQPVARVDLDHVVAYDDGGPTDCDNLCCLCRHHHRLKTHARGWRFVLTAHGDLRVTTPSGITRTTRPPGLRDRIEQRALPASGPPTPPLEEPPPF
jgi:hypothetical protein